MLTCWEVSEGAQKALIGLLRGAAEELQGVHHRLLIGRDTGATRHRCHPASHLPEAKGSTHSPGEAEQMSGGDTTL